LAKGNQIANRIFAHAWRKTLNRSPRQHCSLAASGFVTSVPKSRQLHNSSGRRKRKN